ncbi:general substrate transporter [Periconia macrospinosa]|uniref:General substrate transporter n=1 Tax=Periconia macrospinosa TaxID=97972 RepID=A0A2V1E309_9PLEO|nr:general substrate transporter [Periconia macrospinosa]
MAGGLEKDAAQVREYIHAGITQDAFLETENQKNMTILQALRTYPKAIAFSILMSLCIVMEGYDTALTGNFYGVVQFNKRFGQPVNHGTGQFQLTSAWQSGLQNGTALGQLLGLVIAGYVADRIGYIKTIVGAQLAIITFIFILFFARNIEMLLVGNILCGIPWGAFQTLSTTYAADVTPLRLRPILTTFVNMCWVIGQFISVGVLRGFLHRDDSWAWRIPYALQWIWPPIILLGIIFAPESPTWLVKRERIEEARSSLMQLCNGSREEVDGHLAMIIHTNEAEKRMEDDNMNTSYLDCFEGTNLRRTEVTCGVWMIQVLCGIWFGSNVVYFLQRGGMAEDSSFDFGLGQQALAFLGTACSWFLLSSFGRRTLYLIGQTIMFTILLTVGFMGIAQPREAINWVSGAFLILFTVSFQLTVGPICYCLVTEIPSTRLRIKTVVLARFAYILVSVGANFLNPPILNPLAWNLQGKGGFVWAGFGGVMLIWAFFRLPETKGLSMAEIDRLFEDGVSARKFTTIQVDTFQVNIDNN